MTKEKPPAGTARENAPEELRDLVKYTFFHLRPEWRRLPSREREGGKVATARVLDHPPEGLLVRTYSLVGLKAGPEIMVWTICPKLEPIQEFHSRILGTPLGGYLETSHSYLGMARTVRIPGGALSRRRRRFPPPSAPRPAVPVRLSVREETGVVQSPLRGASASDGRALQESGTSTRRSRSIPGTRSASTIWSSSCRSRPTRPRNSSNS